MSDKKKNPPVARVRVNNLTAAIWSRSSDGRTYFDVTIQRGYQDAEGKWKNTTGINEAALPALAILAARTFDKIQELKAEDVSDKPGDDPLPEDLEEDDIPM